MDNKLSIIIEESGLEQFKAKYILENFKDYFEIAAEWERSAKTIVVTDASQKDIMKKAREGRLFLADKRISVEKARKALKEQSLREGKAIDGIANVLKALIEPIEDYLESQEKFVEIKATAEAEAKRREEAEKAESERIEKEKAEHEEQERVRQENLKLKAEAAEREKEIQKEREKAEAEKRDLEKKAKEAESEKQRIIDEQERKVQEETERIAAEIAAKESAMRDTKIFSFLSQNGYTEENKDQFHIVIEANKVVLFKKIDEINL